MQYLVNDYTKKNLSATTSNVKLFSSVSTNKVSSFHINALHVDTLNLNLINIITKNASFNDEIHRYIYIDNELKFITALAYFHSHHIQFFCAIVESLSYLSNHANFL